MLTTANLRRRLSSGYMDHLLMSTLAVLVATVFLWEAQVAAKKWTKARGGSSADGRRERKAGTKKTRKTKQLENLTPM